MMKKKLDTALPSITIDSVTKHQVKVNAATEDISISAYIRTALRLWAKDDPLAKRIVAQAKKK
jgi:hypothetical protein